MLGVRATPSWYEVVDFRDSHNQSLQGGGL